MSWLDSPAKHPQLGCRGKSPNLTQPTYLDVWAVKEEARRKAFQTSRAPAK